MKQSTSHRLSLVKLPILYRYIFKEIAVPFSLSLFVFTGILFLARILKLVNLVVNKDVALLEILGLFACVIPRFLEIALPMSLLLGIILAFSRLSLDSEIVVIRASGISINKIVWPVIYFALGITILALTVSNWVRPYADYRLGVGLYKIAKSRAKSGLVQGIFNDFGALTIYAEEIVDNGKNLKHLMISDNRDPLAPRTFLAQHGQILSDDKTRSLTLRLYDGDIYEGKAENHNVTTFRSNTISLNEKELTGREPSFRGKRSNEMFLSELLPTIDTLKNSTDPLDKDKQKWLNQYRVELQKRFVLPFSCLSIALVAMALGIQPSRGGFSWGAGVSVVIGILLIVIYYSLFALTQGLGQKGLVQPWLVMWLPDILIGAAGIYLIKQVGLERWNAISQTIGQLFVNLQVFILKLLPKTFKHTSATGQ